MNAFVKTLLQSVVSSTGWLATAFSSIAMSAATAMWAWRPDRFTSDNWLSALSTCGLLLGGVLVKRLVDNTKLAKDGVGDRGK